MIDTEWERAASVIAALRVDPFARGVRRAALVGACETLTNECVQRRRFEQWRGDASTPRPRAG